MLDFYRYNNYSSYIKKKGEFNMSSKTIIPLVEIELADNLYLQIKDVSFIPSKKGNTVALPENSYPNEPSECDWKNENAQLVIKKFEKKWDAIGRPFYKCVSEKEFPVDDSFVYEYYSDIIEAIENMEN
jgi:hypothetical protein